MKHNINEDDIFCLIGSFLGRLKPVDWFVRTDVYDEEVEELIILDSAIKRISKELSVLYDVKETDVKTHKVIK